MPVRIVLVDDHEILRDGLRLRLQQEAGLVVEGEAPNAQLAYDVIGRKLPDLVIMDVDMPGEDGFAATRKVREQWPSIRIIVLTGQFTEQTAQEALKAGAQGFVRKEDATEELVRAVQVVMSGRMYLSPDAATTLANSFVNKTEGSAEIHLTDRELDVLKGMSAGCGYKEIADQLKVSVKSVETYRARLVKKTGCSTRAELVRYAVRNGIVEP